MLMDGPIVVNPTQKPLLQMEFLLRACHQGGWVVDLCCGSGTGVIAALNLQFSVIGFDKVGFQVDATRRRVKEFADNEVSFCTA